MELFLAQDRDNFPRIDNSLPEPGTNDDSQGKGKTPRHVWPWFVLAALILGIILAVIWLKFEIERTRQRRQYGEGGNVVGSVERVGALPQERLLSAQQFIAFPKRNPPRVHGTKLLELLVR